MLVSRQPSNTAISPQGTLQAARSKRFPRLVAPSFALMEYKNSLGGCNEVQSHLGCTEVELRK